ncbi:MAG: hypothetical protein ABIG10_01325 [bacterium]
MYIRIIFNLLLIFLMVIIQQAFIHALPLGFNYLNLVLITLVFILILFNLNLSLMWWLASAWLLDLFSFYPFGSHLLVFGIILLIIYWLLINFFTNRSLYSFLILIIIATIMYDFGMYFANYLFSSEIGIEMKAGWWIIELKHLIFNSGLTIVFFYALNFISHQFKPVFLSKK